MLSVGKSSSLARAERASGFRVSGDHRPDAHRDYHAEHARDRDGSRLDRCVQRQPKPDHIADRQAEAGYPLLGIHAPARAVLRTLEGELLACRRKRLSFHQPAPEQLIT